MNDLFYQELLAEENRRDQIAQAKRHNQHLFAAESALTLLTYRVLSKIGERLEARGAKMQARYNYLATREEYKLLPSN